MNTDKLFEKAKKASKGPWEVLHCDACDERGVEDVTVWAEDGNVLVAQWMESATDNTHNNIDYISSADPQTIIDLIEYARGLREDIDKMEKLLEQGASEYTEMEFNLSKAQVIINKFVENHPNDPLSKAIIGGLS